MASGVRRGSKDQTRKMVSYEKINLIVQDVFKSGKLAVTLDIQTPNEKVLGPPNIYLKHQTSGGIWDVQEEAS